MILKVLSVVDTDIKRNNTQIKDVPEHGIVKSEQFYDNRFFMISHIAKSSINAYGLLDHNTNTTSALSDELESTNRSAILMRFIIVDIKANYIYYDGNRSDVQKILKSLFDLENKFIQNLVDPDELIKLSKLKIISSTTGKMSINDVDKPIDFLDYFDDMFDRKSVEKSTYEIHFKKEGAIFNNNRFKDLYEASKTGLNRLKVEGFDDKGHRVNLSSSFSKKITILEDRSGWNDRVDLKLSTVLHALLKELDYEISNSIV